MLYRYACLWTYEANILMFNNELNSESVFEYLIILHVVQVTMWPSLLREYSALYVLQGTIHSSPPYSSPPKYKHTSQPGSGDDLNVYSNRFAFPPLTIVLHMTFEEHIPLIIIKKLWGWSIWGPKYTLPFLWFQRIYTYWY